MPEMDITSQIKRIESLKCALLNDLAALYESMRTPGATDERDGHLVSLLTHTYLLAGRIGLSYRDLDGEAVKTLKREVMAEGTPDAGLLLKHLADRAASTEGRQKLIN